MAEKPACSLELLTLRWSSVLRVENKLNVAQRCAALYRIRSSRTNDSLVLDAAFSLKSSLPRKLTDRGRSPVASVISETRHEVDWDCHRLGGADDLMVSRVASAQSERMPDEKRRM